jgi:hypothetical protein
LPVCPSCRRPIAVARPSCLYCGAPLPEGVLDEALRVAQAATREEPPPATEPEAPVRTLVVLDLARVEAGALTQAAGLSPYEATLLTRRRGFHLHRVLTPEQAEGAAAQLAAAGIEALLVPEAEARVLPLRVIAGERALTGLLLRTEAGNVAIARGELLIVVTGSITRERQASAERPKVETATPVPSWCVHLHRLSDPRPLEIDASSFEPGFAPTGSTQLELLAWLDEFAQGIPRDDAFRQLTPALAPAEAPAPSALAAVDLLHARPRAATGAAALRARRASAAAGERVVLDNLAQFRFYSGWRAAVERRRRGAGAESAPPSD